MKNLTTTIKALTGVSALAIATSFTFVAPAAYAQDAGTSAENRPGEIIVTARRRAESIQDAPVAMTAINTGALEAKATLNIGDLQGAAPNVLITPQNSGAGGSNLSIRGLAFADIEKTFDPTVGMMVDGVFIGTSTGSYLDFFDIAQIEVLRGPQGTLFGRNTIGGVINIQRTRPTGEFGGKIELTGAEYGTFAARAVVNTSLVEDKLAMKVFAMHNRSNGFYKNAFSGNKGGYENWNYGASFLFTPNENFDALLTIENQDQTFDTTNASTTITGELFGALAPANQINRNLENDLYTSFQEDSEGKYESPALTLEMNWDVGAVRLTSITGYRTSDEDQTQDFDATSSDLYYTRRIQEYNQFSQELRAAGNIGDNIDYVAGLYYFDSEFDFNQNTRFFGGNVGTQLSKGTNKSFAAFADVDFKLSEQWRLSLGGRWTKDEKTYQNGFQGVVTFPKTSFEDDVFTPKVSIDWRPNSDLMIYGSYSQGYRAGGFSNRAQTLISSITPYKSDSVDAYELGFKSSWFDNRLDFNVAAFLTEYSDLQQNTTIPSTAGTGNETIVFNVGTAEKKGLEIDANARLNDHWNVKASVGLLDQSFERFITQGLVGTTLRTYDYSAVNSIYSPDLTASFDIEYTQDLPGDAEWRSTLGYRYLSEYDMQIAAPANQVIPATGTIVVKNNDPRLTTEAQNLVDLTTSVVIPHGDNKMRATIFARNVLDDRGAAASFTVAGLWAFAAAREPRVLGVQLGYEF